MYLLPLNAPETENLPRLGGMPLVLSPELVRALEAAQSNVDNLADLAPYHLRKLAGRSADVPEVARRKA